MRQTATRGWAAWMVVALLAAMLGASPAQAQIDSGSLAASSMALEKVNAEMQNVAERLAADEEYKSGVDAAIASGDKKRLEMLLREGGATSVTGVPELAANLTVCVAATVTVIVDGVRYTVTVQLCVRLL